MSTATSGEGAATVEVPGDEAVGGPWVLADARHRLADLLSRTVLPFPHEVPLQHSYTGDHLYVRRCFHEYYAILRSRLGDPRQQGITVAGSPGTSKSVLMAYVFLRYRLEFPCATIIMISCKPNATVKTTRMWKDGVMQLTSMENELMREQPSRSIVLIDGEPNELPVDLPYVVFTRPSEQWFAQSVDDAAHTMLFMPLWGRAELQVAATQLNLEAVWTPLIVHDFPRSACGRHDREVAYRFDVLGGDARACLAVDPEILWRQLEQRERAVRGLFTADGGLVVHDTLFHYEPTKLRCRAHVRLASVYLAKLVVSQLDKLSRKDGAPLVATVESSPPVKAVCRAMFLDSMQVLPAGECIELRGLKPTNPHVRLNIQSLVFVDATQPDSRGEELVAVQDKRLATIDALYFLRPEDMLAMPDTVRPTVLLFLVTLTATERIQAANILAVLTALHLTPRDAALVFATPHSDASWFRGQVITWDEPEMAAIDASTRQDVAAMSQFVWSV